MPVHGQKVDSKCFTLCRKVDSFLSLENVGKLPVVPPDFWKDLPQNPDLVSSYIVCLIAKLIALDSDRGLSPLPDVYRDLVELPVDFSKYKHWSAKALPTNARGAALELQHAIVCTIYFLKELYGYTPSVHLRHMYLRWNLARNNAPDGSRKIADGFEENVITSFSVAASKQLLHSSQGPASPVVKKDEGKLVRTLVEETYQNHRRAFFGVLPPRFCRLCNNSSISDCLSYVWLRDLVSCSPRLLSVAMQHVLFLLRKEVSHGQEYGEREVLLPLLQLFREFLTMLSPIDTVEVYRLMMPFYLWPAAHSECARRVLDLVLQEGKGRGTTFRRKVLMEHDVGVRPGNTRVRSQLIHMMVDSSHPLSRGTVLFQTFSNRQDKPEQWTLQRLLIRNVFRSVFPSFDVVELEGKLQHLSSEALRGFCVEALDTVEKGEAAENSQTAMETELKQLHQRMLQHADSEEQRDSAVSCTSIDGDPHFTEELLGAFALPPPCISAHALNNCQYPTVQAKLRDILVKSQKRDSPKILETPPTPLVINGRMENQETIFSTPHTRTFSNSSRTSMDSTGSGAMEQERAPLQAAGPIPNGHIAGGEVSRDFHATSPDSGRVTSPDPMSPSSDSAPLGAQHTDQQSSEMETEATATGTDSSETIKNEESSRESSKSPVRTVKVQDSEQNGRQVLSSSAIDEMIDSIFPEDSSDTSSKASEDTASKISDDSRERSITVGPANPSDVNAPQRRGRSGAVLVRTQTVPVGMYSSSPRANRHFKKVYVNVAGQTATAKSMSTVNPGGSLRVKTRPNPSASLSFRQKKMRSALSGALSPTHKPNLKVLKIILAGSDLLVSHAAKAYAYLMSEEPNLFSGMDVRFYHIPLSRASSAYGHIPEQNLASYSHHLNPDLPEPLSEQINGSGNDIHIGRFLAHMDSWYERNVMLAVHNALRLLPCDLPWKPNDKQQRLPSPLLMESDASQQRTSLTPSKILIDTVSSYCREANHCVRVKMFRLKMALKGEKFHKIEHREMYMLHRLDIQRLSGKKATRQVKTYDANVTMTELSLDNCFIRSDMMQMRDIWAVRASNIPRPGDSGVPNPETECLELNIIRAQAEGGRFASAKFRPLDESQYHVYELVLETREKPLTVMVDGDSDVPIENVIRLELTPAYVDQSFFLSTISQSRRNDHRQERQLHFPLMTYWPIDL